MARLRCHRICSVGPVAPTVKYMDLVVPCQPDFLAAPHQVLLLGACLRVPILAMVRHKTAYPDLLPLDRGGLYRRYSRQVQLLLLNHVSVLSSIQSHDVRARVQIGKVDNCREYLCPSRKEY